MYIYNIKLNRYKLKFKNKLFGKILEISIQMKQHLMNVSLKIWLSCKETFIKRKI